MELDIVMMCLLSISDTDMNQDMSLVVRKPVFGVCNQVRHKSGCTTTEDEYRLGISDLESRGIVLSV